MRIVVIGATGNVGTSTLRAFAREAAMPDVIAVARRKPQMEVPRTTFIQADVSHDDLGPIVRGADAVIHLAWQLQPSRDVSRLHAVNVQGSHRVFEAVAAARVPALIYASSIGAYSEGPKHRFVSEEWPTDGVASSLYSRQKVSVERYLDRFERANPDIRVVRMRPALVFKRAAASEIRRLFIGPLIPRALFTRPRLLCIPDVERLRFQCVHSHDVGRAFAMAAMSTTARGPFNLATEPALDPELMASLLHARRLRIRARTLRGLVSAAFRLRLTPTDPGWIDLALCSPLMDTERARMELGWEPRRDAAESLLDLIEGLRHGEGLATAPLHS